MVLVRGFRYLYEELEGVGFDARLLMPAHFDRAAKAARRREEPLSAYKLVSHLEEIGRLLDEYGVTHARLQWSCPNPRPSSASPDRLEDDASIEAKRSRLPDDVVIRALGHLYRSIPRSASWDRLLICLVGILLWTGFRIGEHLSLRTQRVQRDASGQPYLNYYPEKGLGPRKRVIASAGAQVVDEMLEEIQQLTAEARDVANWLYVNQGRVWLPLIPREGCVPLDILAAAIGLGAKEPRLAAVSFLRTQGVRLERAQMMVDVSLLHRVLSEERFPDILYSVPDGTDTLLTKDCLSLAFKNSGHGSRPVMKYVVQPVMPQQISDFLGGKRSTKSVFQRYATSGSESDLRMATHGARHFLNDIADRGGMSEIQQAEFFGRRSPNDNAHYQHMSSTERAEQARRDLLIGRLDGGVSRELENVPIDRREAYLAARLQAVHIVPGGLCLQDFTYRPCRHHVQCTDGCGEFHFIKDDEARRREMKTCHEVTVISLETVRGQLAEAKTGESSWIAHNERKRDEMDRLIKLEAAPTEGHS